MLSVRRGTSLVLPAHDSLKRGKVQLAKGVILITEQTLSSSAGARRTPPRRPVPCGLRTPRPV